MAMVTRDDVLTAAERIVGSVILTPLIEARLGGHAVWLKCENRQRGGAFKLRGARNRLLAMDASERARGVVAFSSGNHAQGVAIAARRLGMKAVIVMPSDAPALKVEGTRAHGAEIVLYDRRSEDRIAIAARIAGESGATLVPSFDDPYIVAGQGSVGIEVLDQLGRSPRRIVIPCGGGGLAAGIALACPEAGIVIVEPDGWDDMGRSLSGGEIVPVAADAPPTLCDALQTPRVSPITYDVLRRRGAAALSVSDEDAFEAIRWAWREHELVVEPGGAVALAAVLTGQVEWVEDLVVIVSGGNIDPALHARIVAQATR
ncbi:MAG: threonine/serine dehydratase [Pseudomonadota bacterium]|nr:threonine/serine dehydratase [Pseudomonadota bacterium]